MPTFTLSNGKRYECPFCGLASVGILYVDVMGLSLSEALSVFGDRQGTKTTVYEAGEQKRTFDGYTVLLGVEYATATCDGAVRVSLRRPYEGE